MVDAILWRAMHSSQQQTFGWFAFLIGVILAASALFTIKKEFHDQQHDKLKKLGGVSLLVAAIISCFLLSDPLRTMDAELNTQMLMWTKMMEGGGYQQEILNEDQENPVNSTFEDDDLTAGQSLEESSTELEFKRRMESYRTGVIPPD